MKRIKTTPVTREDAEALVIQIACAVNRQREIIAEIDARTLELKERHKDELAGIAKSIKEKSTVVQSWAEENPEDFGKAKSLRLAGGTIGFRTGTPKLVLLTRKWTWEKVLEAVQRILPDFIRNKPEVDKEAIIARREELAEFLPMVGLEVAQGESFFIEPDLSDHAATLKEAA